MSNGIPNRELIGKCEKHAGMMDVKSPNAGYYNKELAKAILMAIRSGRVQWMFVQYQFIGLRTCLVTSNNEM